MSRRLTSSCFPWGTARAVEGFALHRAGWVGRLFLGVQLVELVDRCGIGKGEGLAPHPPEVLMSFALCSTWPICLGDQTVEQ